MLGTLVAAVAGTGCLGVHAALPGRISSMLDRVGGVALDSTQIDWQQGVADLGSLVLAANNRYPLSGRPDPASILVYLDGPPPGQTMPGQMAGVPVLATNASGTTNWAYDATSNTLDLNVGYLALYSTDTLYVEYTLACP